MIMFKPIGSLIAVLFIAGASFAQAPAAQAPATAIERMPDGKPDLSGIWQTGGISLTGGLQGNVGVPEAAPGRQLAALVAEQVVVAQPLRVHAEEPVAASAEGEPRRLERSPCSPGRLKNLRR
jgi:hypothetical protein